MSFVSRTIVRSLAIISFAALRITAAETTTQSYADARTIADGAMRALGGPALETTRDIAYRYTGTSFEEGQSVDHSAPYARPVRVEGVLDLRGKRSYRKTETTFTGGAHFQIVSALKESSGFTADLIAHAAYPYASRAVVVNSRAAQRAFPVLLLKEALQKPESLRIVRSDATRKVILFADAEGNVITLFIDPATLLVTKIERLTDTFLEGLGTEETVFSDYRKVAGLTMPFHVRTLLNGELQSEIEYADVRVNTDPAAALFDMPAGFEVGPEVGGAPAITLTRLGQDLYYVNAIPTNGIFFYSSMFAVFNDFVIVVESPLSDRVSQAVIAKIHETAPQKPIRYLLPTHHHTDHLGGIRAYIAEGATVVTTPGNVAFIEKLAAIEHPLSSSPSAHAAKATIETFTKKRVFTDGTHALELYEVGPSPHAGEIVMAYVPAEKIAFVSDLFPVYFKGSDPATSPAFIDFEAKLRELGLQIDTFASGHGKVGTMDDLKRAAARAAASS
jgi:glyoxylase-like metal-dependent hydrolase (beta-lactamase superfamily II)